LALNAQLNAACATSSIIDYITHKLYPEHDKFGVTDIKAKIRNTEATITKYNWRLRACRSHNPNNLYRIYQPVIFGYYYYGWYRIGKYEAPDFDFRLITENTLSLEDQIHHSIKKRYALQLLKQWWVKAINRMKLNSSKRSSYYRRDVTVFDTDYRACFFEYYTEYDAYVREHDRIVKKYNRIVKKKYGGVPIDRIKEKILKDIIDESDVAVNGVKQKIKRIVAVASFALTTTAMCIWEYIGMRIVA